MALGLVALAVRLDPAALAQVLVDELALAGRHRVERHRPPVALGVHGGLVGLLLEGLAATGAVALRVDHDAPARRLHVGEQDPLRQVLHRVDRLPVAADEEPEVVALERRGHRLLGRLEVDVGSKAHALRELLEELDQHRVLPLDVHPYRLRPERLRLRRGGGGGAFVVRAVSSAEAPFPAPSLGALLRPAVTALAPAGAAAPFPAVTSAGFHAAGWPLPITRRRNCCCPMVQTFVVIQYMIRPAGKLRMNGTKTNGSTSMIVRWFLSVVAVSIRRLETSCVPTYSTISVIRTPPVALFVMSGMNQNSEFGEAPHGTGFWTWGGLISGQMSCRRSLRSM